MVSSRHKKAAVHMNPQHLQLLVEALHKTKTVKNSSKPSQPLTTVGIIDPWSKPTIAIFLKQYIL